MINTDEKPLAIYEDGIDTYIIYGVRNYGAGFASGYPILKVSEPTTTVTRLYEGLLLEVDRMNGANGSVVKVNLKEDTVNTLLLLTNPTIIYG